jgi:hypothetical protein
MNSIIKNIQIFIKNRKKDVHNFENLRVILSKHLILKNKKMKDLDIKEFIQYIDEIREYINLYNSKKEYQELQNEIETFLYEQTYLSF